MIAGEKQNKQRMQGLEGKGQGNQGLQRRLGVQGAQSCTAPGKSPVPLRGKSHCLWFLCLLLHCDLTSPVEEVSVEGCILL